MNFREKFKKGLEGLNFGLPTGLDNIDIAIGGVQKGAIYTVAAAPKVGKSTFVNYSFLLSPYLHYLEELKKGNPTNLEIEWIYFSFEMSRLKMEFKFIPFFMDKDYKIRTFNWKEEVYDISPNYIEGKMRDNDKQPIIPSEEHQRIILEIYEKRIIPLFGEYNEKGLQIKKGIVNFIEKRENPTGLRNFIGNYSSNNGTWIKSKYWATVGKDSNGQPIKEQREKREGWIPNNPNKYTIIITDHMRKIPKERGFDERQTINKMVEYQVELRNWCDFTFVDIIHLNRNMNDTNRLKYNNEFIYPLGDDIKGSGNLSEESDYIFTMMNPNDERYNLSKHFGLQIKTTSNDEIYPGYTSIHLVESRDTECPNHFRSILKGAIGSFEELVENTGYGSF